MFRSNFWQNKKREDNKRKSLKMNQGAVFNPRFSVRNAAPTGIVDVSQGRYSTNAGRLAQSKTQDQRISVQARGPRNPEAPTTQDRLHWMSQNRVDAAIPVTFVDDNGEEVRNVEVVFEEAQGDIAVERARWQVAPPAIVPTVKYVPEEPTPDHRKYWQSDAVVAEPARQTDFQKFGEREGNLQREMRRRKNMDMINPDRPFRFEGPVHFEDAPIVSELASDFNAVHRPYWGGRTVVQAPSKKASRFQPKNE